MRRKLNHFLFIGLFAGALLSAPPPAWAQIFADESARSLAAENERNIQVITDLLREINAKVSRLEQAQAQTAALTQKSQALETQLRTLNGKLEELEQQIKVSQRKNQGAITSAANKQEKVHSELQGALSTMQQQLAALQNNLQELTQFVELPPEEQLYASAYADYQGRNIEKAITGFNRVLRYYPQGQFAANCLHWLGQAHLTQGDFPAARGHAETLIANYPKSDRRADAMLTRARALNAEEQAEQARTQLQALISEYPTSLAADSARQLLAQ